MKRSVVLGRNTVLCPCCGYSIVVDATVRLKGEPRPSSTLQPLLDQAYEAAADVYEAKAEAERHE